MAAYLKTRSYKIFPVNPTISLQDPVPSQRDPKGQGSRGMGEETLGEKSYPRLEDIPEPIDVVDIFRAPEHVPPIVESAIAMGGQGGLDAVGGGKRGGGEEGPGCRAHGGDG